MSDGDGPKLGLVLSGGGARGAYEVGVLDWIATHRPRVLDHIRVVTGASVGAVNGMFIASRGCTPQAVRELVDVWSGLVLPDLMSFSFRQSMKMLGAGGVRLFRRRTSPPVGLFQAGGLQDLISESVLWDGLHEVVQSGRMDAVAVAATEIGTGRTHIFVDHAPGRPSPRWPHDRTMIGISTPVRAEHVLASTSIPFLFAPIQVGDYWYTDGGVRQNTPLSPALRLGAERLLAISLAGPDHRPETPGVFPGLGQLLGKLFNSLFLDRMMWDLDRLDRINDVLAAGERAFGKAFMPRLQEELKRLGRRPYRPVAYVNIRPQDDIGTIAARVLRDETAVRRSFSRPMRSLLASDNLAAADAASYLLFDGHFADAVMDLGRDDAAAHADDFDLLLA